MVGDDASRSARQARHRMTGMRRIIRHTPSHHISINNTEPGFEDHARSIAAATATAPSGHRVPTTHYTVLLNNGGGCRKTGIDHTPTWIIMLQFSDGSE